MNGSAYLKNQIVSSSFLKALALIIAAFFIRISGIGAKGLWYDEIQSVTHAILPLKSLLVSVERFDPHPPLYYLQLHLWMLLGTSDMQVKFNSVLWSLAAVISLAFVSMRGFGYRVALSATAFFVLAPYAVEYAQEARMYSMLMCLGIWHFYFLQLLLAGRLTKKVWLGIAIVSLAILYSHGAGFLIFFPLLVCFLLYIRIYAPLSIKQTLFWLSLFGSIIVLYYPWLVRAHTITVGHTLLPNTNDFVSTVFILLFGFNTASLFLRWIAVVILFAALLFAWHRRERNNQLLTVGYTLAPILACLLISYLNRPIWLHRTLAFSVPFLWLSLAVAIIKIPTAFPHLQENAAYFVYGSVILIGIFQYSALISQKQSHIYPWDFRGGADFLQTSAKADDRLYVPNERVFWGVAWYVAGPGRMNALDPVNSVNTGDSRSIFMKIEPSDMDKNNFWVVRRENDDIGPFSARTPTIDKNFRGLHILYFPSEHND